eukprot:GGOE01003963.1.p1 GENE.GGOE01003963.1~~GGOE01003963.1.p1  ORF type:complete len:242 (-),score=55.29 GGOE01003963.1:154-879(-)
MPSAMAWADAQVAQHGGSFLEVYHLFGIPHVSSLPVVDEERAAAALGALRGEPSAWQIMLQTKECMTALHAYHDLQVQGVFLYGTLRPDALSDHEPWRGPLLQGVTLHKGVLAGAQLWRSSAEAQPFIHFLEPRGAEPEAAANGDRAISRFRVGPFSAVQLVVGYFLGCESEEQFFQKLTLCDQLLGYPASCRRVVKDIQLTVDGRFALCKAWVHQCPFDESAEYTHIATGDWTSQPQGVS